MEISINVGVSTSFHGENGKMATSIENYLLLLSHHFVVFHTGTRYSGRARYSVVRITYLLFFYDRRYIPLYTANVRVNHRTCLHRSNFELLEVSFESHYRYYMKFIKGLLLSRGKCWMFV